VINPLDVIEELGADALRIYEMFMGPFDQMKPWNTKTIQGVRRFLDRVYNLRSIVTDGEADKKVEVELNKLIKKAGEDIENFKFNTTVAEFMKFTNLVEEKGIITKDQWIRFLVVLAPFAPYITEEMWHEVHGLSENTAQNSIHMQKWPSYDAASIVEDTVIIGVQINGKLRSEIEVAVAETEETVREKVLAQSEVQKWIDGKEMKKFIYVPGKIVNIVAA
jgi:leucyl-tRNA synthetase